MRKKKTKQTKPWLPVSDLTGKDLGLVRCSWCWPQSHWSLPRMVFSAPKIRAPLCFYFPWWGHLRLLSYWDVSWGCFSAEREYPVTAFPTAAEAPTLSQCQWWGRDTPGGYSHARGGVWGGTGQQVSLPKRSPRSLSCHCAALPGQFLEGSCRLSQPELCRIPHWGPNLCRGL